MRRSCPSIVIAVFLLVATLGPATAAEIELTPSIGYAFGTVDEPSGIFCIALVGVPCPTRVTTEESAVFGLVLDVGLGNGWAFETRLSRQPTERRLDIGPLEVLALPGTGEIFILPASSVVDLDITRLELGARRSFEAGRGQLFVTATAGIARVESDGPLFSLVPEIDGEGLTGGLGGGYQLPLASRIGWRIEARGLYTDLPDAMDDDLVQVELSTGLAFRLSGS